MIKEEDILQELIKIINKYENTVENEKCNNEKWITIKGTHILLKDGETVSSAFRRVTGVDLDSKTRKQSQQKTPKEHKPSKAYTQILNRIRRDNKTQITSHEVIKNAGKALGLSIGTIKHFVKKADEYAEYIKNNGLETQKKYSKNGVYTAERQAKHQEIIDDIFKNEENAKPKNGEKPKVIFLGGRGGSGKSKFEGMVYNKDNFIVLDADEIKNHLEEYKGFNAFEVHEESSDILNLALKKAKEKGLNIVLDATMKKLTSTENKIKAFQDLDYDIEMHYMHLPREKAAERAIGRYAEKNRSFNGRYVPIDIILNEMKHNEENFDALKHYATKWSFYSNDVKEGQPPLLIDKNF